AGRLAVSGLRATATGLRGPGEQGRPPARANRAQASPRRLQRYRPAAAAAIRASPRAGEDRRRPVGSHFARRKLAPWTPVERVLRSPAVRAEVPQGWRDR